MSEWIILGMFVSVLYETRQAAAYWASKVHIFLSVGKVENLLFFSLFYFFPFTEVKIHWLHLVLLFFSSLLPLFKTCQVSNVILLVWVRVHGVCSKDGLMNQGLQCSWLTLAGRNMETRSLHCLQSCQDICKSILGSYHGFLLKVKDIFEGDVLCKQIPQQAFKLPQSDTSFFQL